MGMHSVGQGSVSQCGNEIEPVQTASVLSDRAIYCRRADDESYRLRRLPVDHGWRCGPRNCSYSSVWIGCPNQLLGKPEVHFWHVWLH